MLTYNHYLCNTKSGNAMKSLHDLYIELGKCYASQGIGARFSQKLERRIASLKISISKIEGSSI